jgi:fatty-acyl-CoA synthase
MEEQMNPSVFPDYSYDYQLLIKHLLERTVDWSPNQEIVYRDKFSYNYLELNRRIKKLANLLDRLGVQKGDVVAVMDWDSHRYLENYFAVPMIGAILHTVNIRLSPDQMLYTINHAEDKILIVHKDFMPLVKAIAPNFDTIKHIIYISDVDDDYEPEVETYGEYEKLITGEKEDYEFPDFDENSIATLFYTTGTTGNPKGVFFSHRQIVLHTISVMAALSAYNAPVSFTYKDVYMPLTPMFHVHAWGIPYIATWLGVKQVYPGRYDEMIVKLLLQHKVTMSHCVPTILQMVVGNPATEKFDFSNWKVVIGGSALSRGLAEMTRKRNIKVMTGYGMSETAPVLTLAQFKPEVIDLSHEEEIEVITKTGFPIPFVKMKIVDEKGVEAAQGKVGEIVVRSPWLTSGYFKSEKNSEELWKGGWLHTGDIAFKDEEGYFKITDRLKDVIKTGGEWISSLELESYISRCSFIKQVAVIGVPDEKWGERPVAFISLKDETDQENIDKTCRENLQTFVESGRIEKWAIPDRFIVVDEIPKTSVGKLDKKLLRKIFAEKY